MRAVSPLCCLLLVAGCGEVVRHQPDAGSDGGLDPLTDGARSGTRLKLVWHDFGGTRALSGLFDAERKEPCTQTAWSDGKEYCTPYAAGVVYVDAACTQPAGAVTRNETCPEPAAAYFVDYTYTSCAGKVAHMYPRGERIAATKYYAKTGEGTCTTAIIPTNLDFYALGPEISPSALVELTRQRIATTSRLAPQFVASADGARVFDLPHDATLAAACRFLRDYAGTGGTCFPSDSQVGNQFSDASCTQPKLGVFSSCPKPAFTLLPNKPGCPDPEYRFFAVGDAVNGDPLYARSSNACTAITPSGQATYYGVTAEVTPPQVSRAHDTASGRTVQQVYYSDGTNRWRDRALYDQPHDTECDDTLLPDGSYRCLPRGGNVGSYYTDGTCTTPIELMHLSSGADGCKLPTVPPFALKPVLPPAGQCGANYEVYAVGVAYTRPVYQKTGGGVCVAAQPGYLYYQLGAKHALDQFPLATTVTDP